MTRGGTGHSVNTTFTCRVTTSSDMLRHCRGNDFLHGQVSQHVPIYKSN